MTTNNVPTPLLYEAIWLESNRYEEAEIQFHEFCAQEQRVAKPASNAVGKSKSVISLSDEIAYARQRIQNTLKSGDMKTPEDGLSSIYSRLLKVENDNKDFTQKMAAMLSKFETVCSHLSKLEKGLEDANLLKKPIQEQKVPQATQNGPENDDEVDLFGSDEETEEDMKIREERLKAYENKKSKKPAPVAKSSIVLDVKPWDDTTDMKAMEVEVRKIEKDGLKWGASNLVPLAYGIKKLQIVAIVEDEKVSVDWLQETIQDNEDLVQSVDIAAFNKL